MRFLYTLRSLESSPAEEPQLPCLHKEDAPTRSKSASVQWGISMCISAHLWGKMTLLLHYSTCSNKKTKTQKVLPCSPHHQVLLCLHVHHFDPKEQIKQQNVTAKLIIMLQQNMNRNLGFLSKQTNYWEGTEEYTHKG